MIIHKPKIEKKNEKICISSYIEVETDKTLSNTLWYEFDKEYEKHISTNSNGFVTAMLFLAMNLGEDIKVKGKISPKLSYGLKQLQAYFNFWHQKDFKIIKIRCDGFEIEKQTPKGVMCTFSGGVDSFYTLYSHLPGNEDNPQHQLTHCLLIDGFALPRTDKLNYSYKVVKESYEKLTKKLGIKLVFVTTNLADFYHRKIDSFKIDGPVLSSVPLILSSLVSYFHIASCLIYSQILPRGSNAITNGLLSTEKLTVTIHGSDKSRLKKTIAISDKQETYDQLRVCWEDVGVKNCCKCEKCIRTMITLESAGALSKYKTFPLPLTRSKVRKWELLEKHNFWFAKEIIDYARRKGRSDIVFDVKYAIIRNRIRNKIQDMFDTIWKTSAFLKKRSRLYKTFIKLIK